MKQKNMNAEFIISANLKISGDLKRFKYPFFGYVLSAFQQFEQGVMPFEGSYSDQPAQIMEIFDTLQQLKFESDERHRREAERKKAKNG